MYSLWWASRWNVEPIKRVGRALFVRAWAFHTLVALAITIARWL